MRPKCRHFKCKNIYPEKSHHYGKLTSYNKGPKLKIIFKKIAFIQTKKKYWIPENVSPKSLVIFILHIQKKCMLRIIMNLLAKPFLLVQQSWSISRRFTTSLTAQTIQHLLEQFTQDSNKNMIICTWYDKL